MIYLYSGTPGSGKSLHQAKDIYDWLRKGKVVIANFDIDVNKIPKCKGQFIYLDNTFLKPDTLIKFARVYFNDHKFKEGAIRLYVDECQILLNSRDNWQTGDRKNGFHSFHSIENMDMMFFLLLNLIA